MEIFDNGIWCIDEKFLTRWQPLAIKMLLEGKGLEQFKDASLEGLNTHLQTISLNQSVRTHFNDEIGASIITIDGFNVLSLPVVGTMTRNGGFCSTGTVEMANIVNRANESADVDGMLGFFDGPGGQVNGVPFFHQSILNFNKPSLAFVDLMAASAQYYAASAFNTIVLNENDDTQVGSIGALAIVTNESKRLENEGITVEIVRARGSEDKARLNSVEPIEQSLIEELKDDVTITRDAFVEDVTAARAGKIDTSNQDPFTGKMFKKEAALSIGLADYIGTYSGALNELLIQIKARS